MTWITLTTTSLRWEAELMAQILQAHRIQVRLIDRGGVAYWGMGSPTAIQVPASEEWPARLLLSHREESDPDDENI